MRYIVTINGIQHTRTDDLRQARRMAQRARAQGAVLILDIETGVRQ